MTQFPGPEDQPSQPQYGNAPPPAPGYGYGQPVPGGTPPPPPNYLVWSILTTIFCCLPLGIVSIVFAAQVNGKHAAGDAAGAQESSAKAKKFAIWSAIASVIVALLSLTLIVVLSLARSSN